MKIIFFGSDDFALVHLRALIRSRHTMAGCVTQPDRPKGRHLHVIPPEPKQEALKRGVPVFQPAHLKDEIFIQNLQRARPDLFVVVAYGRFLPRVVRDIPRLLCINVHASLLPKYRGAAPMNWVIVNGESVTGVTVMEVSSRMDSGDILAQRDMSIGEEETAQSLREKLAPLGSALLLETIDKIENNDYSLTRQDENRATYAPKLNKEDGRIDWKCDARFIHNMVRGFRPWPSAFTCFGGKRLKLMKTRVVNEAAASHPPGTCLAVTEQGFSVATGQGVLEVIEVQPEAAKLMAAKSFLAGHRLTPGYRFSFSRE